MSELIKSLDIRTKSVQAQIDGLQLQMLALKAAREYKGSFDHAEFEDEEEVFSLRLLETFLWGFKDGYLAKDRHNMRSNYSEAYIRCYNDAYDIGVKHERS